MSSTASDPSIHKDAPHRFVIIGGGAGGLELASYMGKFLRRRKDATLTLIDSSPNHIWKPLLHEVAAGNLDANEDAINYLVHAHNHHYRFRLGEVQTIDRNEKKITTSPVRNIEGEVYIPQRNFYYDTLVIAVGSVTHDYGVSGVREFCHFVDHRENAEALHQHILQTACAIHTKEKNEALSIAIVGAGATGIELAAELYEYTHRLVRYGLDGIDPEKDVKISIVDSVPRILPSLAQRLSDEVQKQLEKMHIHCLTNKKINRASAAGFHTDTDELIPANVMIWAAGIRAPAFLGKITGLECNNRNQILVRNTLQTTTDDDIFALGDCAACLLPAYITTNRIAQSTPPSMLVPPRAQAAHQQAAMLAHSLKKRLQGKSDLPQYHYTDYGSLVHLSRYSTVGSLMGSIARRFSCNVFIEGLLARLVYFFLYKVHQIKIQGILQISLLTLAGWLRGKNRPRIKLH